MAFARSPKAKPVKRAPSGSRKRATASSKPRATRARALPTGPLGSEEGLASFHAALADDEPWYPAMLEVIGRWAVAEEMVDRTRWVYLIAGEAFDWLRLAQRLIESAGKLIPKDEAERLLLFGVMPEGADDDEFARALGVEKHRAHLNFQYGVIVEEALLLTAENALNKAGALSGSNGALADVEAYERVYGRPYEELIGMYGAEIEAPAGERMSLSEWQAFTYWCSKYRFRMGEPARVASDTRKALALLSTMESSRARLGGLSLNGAKRIVVKS
ncbi:MAG TPA: hypothetical protein QGI71_11640 [Dehalococcoidia bacterium]|jgi:hypothetical protein|nr:hypothetical protein [Dehalococcoidia bacterium]